MAKIRISYPTIMFHDIFLDVSEERASEIMNMTNEEKEELTRTEANKEPQGYALHRIDGGVHPGEYILTWRM